MSLILWQKDCVTTMGVMLIEFIVRSCLFVAYEIRDARYEISAD